MNQPSGTMIREGTHYKVENRGYETPCWIWTRRISEKGYGRIDGPDGRRAHRRAYRQQVGEIPTGMILYHLCGQPACVHGSHLVPVTPAEHRRVHSVLDVEKVQAIRASTRTERQLAVDFGVSRSTIGLIRRGHIWN